MFSSRYNSKGGSLLRYVGIPVAFVCAAILLQGCFLTPLVGGEEAQAPAAPETAGNGSLSEWLNSHTPMPPGMSGETGAPAAISSAAGNSAEELPTDDPVLRTGYTIVVSVTVGEKAEVEPTLVQVSDQNEVTLPLIGKVDCTDMTLNAFRSHLATRYSVYYVNPEVTASFVVTETGASPWGAVLVQGRVLREGWVNIPATRDLTVTRAIQMAGGFGPSASKDDVVVHRTNPDGTKERLKVDIRSIGRRGKLENDILLQSGDVINVYESNF